MTIELNKQHREQVILFVQRYSQENLNTRLVNVAAGGLLSFFIEELGPSIYTKGVLDAQERIQACVSQLSFAVHEGGSSTGESTTSHANRNRDDDANPSLKRSANGRPPGPVWRYAVHFRQPGPGVLPSSPA